MLADVTNRARGARGFALVGGATHLLEPGQSARLDLAAHTLHDVWAAAGEIAAVPVDPVEPDVRDPADRGRGPGQSPDHAAPPRSEALARRAPQKDAPRRASRDGGP